MSFTFFLTPGIILVLPDLFESAAAGSFKVVSESLREVESFERLF